MVRALVLVCLVGVAFSPGDALLAGMAVAFLHVRVTLNSLGKAARKKEQHETHAAKDGLQMIAVLAPTSPLAIRAPPNKHGSQLPRWFRLRFHAKDPLGAKHCSRPVPSQLGDSQNSGHLAVLHHRGTRWVFTALGHLSGSSTPWPHHGVKPEPNSPP